jgi:uncharacterized protein
VEGGVNVVGLADLRKIAANQGVPQAIVEKDLALSVALVLLSGSPLSGHVVFKGGTAIRKAYFREARFSEDLDFTAFGISQAEVLPLLRKAIEGRESSGIKFGKIADERTSAGVKASAKFTGPLGHPQRIRFDFSFRDNLAGKPEMKAIMGGYGAGVATLPVLALKEIMAEKLHALCSRAAPRDMYDIWFLMKKDVHVDKGTLAKKFSFYEEKFSSRQALGNISKIEAEWKRDLQPLMARLPDAKEVSGYLKEKLKKLEQ